MMIKQILILVGCFLSFSLLAQKVDVYQNKSYEVNSRIFKVNIVKDYLQGENEFTIDKNKEPDQNWENIEEQLYDKVNHTLSEEVDYFKIHSKIKNQIAARNEWKRILNDRAGAYYSFLSNNFELEEVEVQLLSVVNNFGTYAILYNFEVQTLNYNQTEILSVKEYYLADYKNQKIIQTNTTSNSDKETVLKKMMLPKIKKWYLMTTQKIALDDIERIQNLKENDPLDLTQKIDFSEAIVYPYFSGIMIEFPAFSKSSQIFDYGEFRYLFTEDELADLLKVYPEFKPIFKQKLRVPSKETTAILNQDNNFDLARFGYAPLEIKAFELLKLQQPVYSVELTRYIIRDTSQNRTGTKVYFYDKQQNLLRIEENDGNHKFYNEKKYYYNDNGLLMAVRDPSNFKLDLYNYKNHVLSSIEKIFLDRSESVNFMTGDIEVSQQQFIYNGNYRYSIETPLFGELSPYGYASHTNYRTFEKNKYCSESYCLLTNDENHVIGVKFKKYGMASLLTNEKGQALEYYYDNDRQKRFFKYDEEGRIIEYKGISDDQIYQEVKYEYPDDKHLPLIIKETRSGQNFLYEYKVQYFE